MSSPFIAFSFIKNLIVGMYSTLVHPLFTAPAKRAAGTLTCREKIHCIRVKAWFVFILVALVFPASAITATALLVLGIDLVVLLASILGTAILATAEEQQTSTTN